MPFAFSDDEEAVRKVVREFARTRITLQSAQDADRHDRVPEAALAEAVQLGLTALADPASPLGATPFVLAIDEIAQVDANAAAILIAHNAALAAAAAAGHPLAPALAAGEFAAWLVAEEALGSDILHPGTTAMPTPGGFAITGQKVWAIHAAGARHFLVLANVPGKGGGATLLHVPADTAGVSLGENEPLLGLRACGIRTVYMYGVQVPTSAVIGGVGQGAAIAEAARRWLQLGAAAALCGCVGGALDAAAAFAQTRRQFNAPIGTYQAVSDGLATIDTQLAAGRALVCAAAARLGQADGHLWAARAKAFCAEMAVPMTRQAIRIQGGTGFMRDGGTERFARDVRALQFVGESTQMQRDAIKRELLSGIDFPPTP
ncbi:MAG: acyl-CoA dehydrogenase family protein [bacterium]